MKTLAEVLEALKSNKIGKGCKHSHVSNKVYIAYPIHKTINGQYSQELKAVRDLFPLNSIQGYCMQNKGGINIWIG